MVDLNSIPNDENGDVLRRMAEAGMDLSKECSIDFAHRAPDEESANAFAEHAARLGFAVEIFEPDEEALDDGETDWDVICTQEMKPTHAEITRIESQLAAIASEH